MGKVSIERGRINAAMGGARYSSAYCECKIGGESHVVDLTLVPGWSALDHMADVPLAAGVEALSGKEFGSEGVARRTAFRAMRDSLTSGPRIDLTFTAGTLAGRWQAENIAALLRKVGDGAPSPLYFGGHNFTEGNDGNFRVRVELSDPKYGNYGYCVATCDEDPQTTPDIDWSVGPVKYYV